MATRLAPFLHKYRHATRFCAAIIRPSVESSQRISSSPTTRIYPAKFHIRRHNSNEPEKSSDYFPWCHSASLPERIKNLDDLSGMPNNFRARFVRRLIAGKELNLKLWDVLPLGFEREWEEELASNFATAYGMALSELLKSVFHVPVENDLVTISIDSSLQQKEEVRLNANKSTEEMLTIEQDQEGKNETDAIQNDAERPDTDVFSSVEKTPLVENEYLTSMVDKNLLARYQLVDTESIHLKLSITPTSAKLQHLFAIPMLTREIVEQKPELTGAYLRIEKEFEETKSYDRVREMTYALADDVGRDSYKRTVIAEAVIQCSEFFQVRDAATGEILRGMEDEDDAEEVAHLVRFEVVTDKKDDGQGRDRGNWKIIDWDDLLEGNVFH